MLDHEQVLSDHLSQPSDHLVVQGHASDDPGLSPEGLAQQEGVRDRERESAAQAAPELRYRIAFLLPVNQVRLGEDGTPGGHGRGILDALETGTLGDADLHPPGLLVEERACSSRTDRIGPEIQELAIFADLHQGDAARAEVQDVAAATVQMRAAPYHRFDIIDAMVPVLGKETRKGSRDTRGGHVLLKFPPKATDHIEGLPVVRTKVMVDHPPGGVQSHGLDVAGAYIDAHPHGAVPSILPVSEETYYLIGLFENSQGWDKRRKKVKGQREKGVEGDRESGVRPRSGHTGRHSRANGNPGGERGGVRPHWRKLRGAWAC